MIICGTSVCPNCSGKLKHYDSVNRIIRGAGRHTSKIKIRRLRCADCNSLHRELPTSIEPYKQYESSIIRRVRDGVIDSDTLEYENYPCEMTMKRWARN